MRRFISWATRPNAGRGLQALACALAAALWFFGPAPDAARADAPIRVYVFAGQSNMVGADTSSSDLATVAPGATLPSARVLFWGPIADFPTQWGPLEAPTEVVQARTHHGFGPEIGAAGRLARKHVDSTIAIVKFAESGTSLYRDWDPAVSKGLYRRMISRVRDAVTSLRTTRRVPVEISGFFWMQGESDSERFIPAAAYDDNLASFIRSVRTDLRSPRLPFVIGRIRDLRRDMPYRYQYSDAVRKSQAEVARTVPHTYLVPTEGLERTSGRLHFSSRGTFELGRRFVDRRFAL